MSVSATEATGYTGMLGTTSTTSSTGASTTTSSSTDKNMFLQLLVAQMKYQDPMNPTDSSQFLSQSAQFTSLEKMQDVADQTSQLLTSQMAFGASSLVGRTVSWTDSNGATQTGSVSGVTFSTDGPMLDVGSTQLSLSQVQSVKGSTSSTTSSTTGS
ncbi:flagellar hook assembly protein FlgD [Nocardioides mangrovicus]|nr:flagellar hook capping FlgD N-terminal domain-containing protein [Nocardioides mangrovicus]